MSDALLASFNNTEASFPDGTIVAAFLVDSTGRHRAPPTVHVQYLRHQRNHRRHHGRSRGSVTIARSAEASPAFIATSLGGALDFSPKCDILYVSDLNPSETIVEAFAFRLERR